MGKNLEVATSCPVERLGDWRSHHGRDAQGGFTVLEMVVATSVFLVAMIAYYNFMDRAAKIARTQEEGIDMIASARTTSDILVSEIREAGFNPTLMTGVTWISSTSTAAMGRIVDFRVDRNGDGDTADTAEYVRFEFIEDATRATLHRRDDRNGNGSFDIVEVATVALNLQKSAPYFRYYSSAGVELVAASDLPANATRVNVAFSVISAKPDRVTKKYKSIS